MATQTSQRDPNRVTTLLGVDSAGFTLPTTIAADPTTHEMLVKASFSGTGSATVIGTLTNNNAAPGTTNIGSLTAIANTAAPTWIEGDQVLLSVDLKGYNRTIIGNAGTNASVSTTGADGAAAANGLVTSPQLLIYNGATWDRLREVVNSTDSPGTGIPATGILAQLDDTSPSSVTENQFGNVRMNSARQLYAQPIKIDTFGTTTAFTITLASLANSTAGVGRQTTLVTSNKASSALIGFKFTTGTTPTINTLIYLYLIRGDGTINDDNAGASDAGITIINAPLLGTLLISATTSNATYYGLFDTKFLGSLGPTFGAAVVNSSGTTANTTAGNFLLEYTLIT